MNKIIFYIFTTLFFASDFFNPNFCFSQEKNEKLAEKISNLESKLKEIDNKVGEIKSSTEKNLKEDLMEEFKKFDKKFDKIEGIIKEKENKEKELARFITRRKEDSLEILRLKIELKDSSRIIQIRGELNGQIKKIYKEKEDTLRKLNERLNSIDTKQKFIAKNLQNLDVNAREWNEDSLITIQKTIDLLGTNLSLEVQRIDDYFSLVKHLTKGNQLMNKGFTNIQEVQEYNSGLLSFRDSYRSFPKLSNEFEKISKLMGPYEGKILELDKLFKLVIADKASSLDFKKVNVLKPMHIYSDYPYLIQLIKTFSASPDKNPLEGKLR
jgi:hypothetical protein